MKYVLSVPPCLCDLCVKAQNEKQPPCQLWITIILGVFDETRI